MASYLLFFPGAGGMSAQPHLNRCGLADLSRDRSPEVAKLDRGPDRQPGLLAVWRTGDAATDPPLALTESQVWQPCRARGDVAAGAYWIGVDSKRPVAPADIARKKQHPGYWLRLADGQAWHCPSTSMLPHRHGLGEDGRYCRTINEKFEWFATRSNSYAQALFGIAAELTAADRAADAPGKAVASFDLANVWEFVVEALAMNYRVNAELVDVLKLIDDDALRNIIKAAIDLPILIERKKGGPRPRAVLHVDVAEGIAAIERREVVERGEEV